MTTTQALFPTDPAVDAACKTFACPDRVRASPGEDAYLANAQRSDLTVDGEQIVYWTLGQGPRVLLVHGWCSRGSHLLGFVDPLRAAGFSIALFDAAGHGESGGLLSSMIHAGRAALALAAHLGDVEQVVSHSGGSTATLWAIANGLAVKKSVHICGPSSMKQVVMQTARAHCLDARATQAFQDWVEHFTGVTLDTSDLHAVSLGLLHPGLIIHDFADRVVNVFESKAVHAAWPRSELIITEGLGHRRILNAPSTIAAVVEFLQRES